MRKSTPAPSIFGLFYFQVKMAEFDQFRAARIWYCKKHDALDLRTNGDLDRTLLQSTDRICLRHHFGHNFLHEKGKQMLLDLSSYFFALLSS